MAVSLLSLPASATVCDVDADGDIDRNDYLAILADIGESARGPDDPRDADQNGRILSNDPQLCARRCTLALCNIPTNQAPIANDPAPTVPPVANNDTAGTTMNTPVTINVVTNDTDANGNLDPTSVAIAANPANGTAVPDGNDGVIYTPNLGFFGTDGFTYRINDSQGAISNVATVTVGVNAAPTADAGPDANAVTGQLVTLDGSASSDPNGDMITYSWRFLSVPPASALGDADIVNPASPAPMFTPDVDGAYELELTVADPGALSDTDTVVITAATPNVAPNADAGPDQNAEVLTLVNLDGSGSSDPDNGPVTPLMLQWSFVSVPLGSGIDETDLQPDANSTQPSFTPDVIGLYRLTVIVSDGDLSDSDDVDITVALPNVPPNADAGSDIVVQLGPPAESATLNDTGSNDPDTGPVTPLTFEWSFVNVPLGSGIDETDLQPDANSTQPSFTSDVAGIYTLQLRVFDGLDEDFDQVMVTANAAPVAVGDSFTTDEDLPLNAAAPGVLGNDTDANNDALTAVLDSGSSNASAFTS
ncbi:MAG: PKD domain-containing protein [Gammaproteobacteria bacterium]